MMSYILCFSYVVIELRLLLYSIEKHRFERRSNSQLWNLFRLFNFFRTTLCRLTYHLVTTIYFAFRNVLYIVPHFIVFFYYFSFLLTCIYCFIVQLIYSCFMNFVHTVN